MWLSYVLPALFVRSLMRLIRKLPALCTIKSPPRVCGAGWGELAGGGGATNSDKWNGGVWRSSPLYLSLSLSLSSHTPPPKNKIDWKICSLFSEHREGGRRKRGTWIASKRTLPHHLIGTIMPYPSGPDFPCFAFSWGEGGFFFFFLR